MIFVGLDWSEEHHDVEVRDAAGERLATRRVRHGVAGITELHELFGELAEDPVSVVVGLETDRGLLVSSLVAAGYQVYAINPKSVDRYRDRHGLSGAKSDAGDATVLAELVRTDRHHHRVVADQRVQPPDPLDALGHPLASEHPPVLVHDPHVVVVLGAQSMPTRIIVALLLQSSPSVTTRALEEVWRTA